MALPKLFTRIFWHNNTTPAINEDNLNAMSKGLSDVDDRVIELAGAIMEDLPRVEELVEEAEASAESAAGSASSANTAKTQAQAAAESATSSAEIATNAANIATNAADRAEDEADRAEAAAETAEEIIKPTEFWVDFSTGLLMYTHGDVFDFYIDTTSGDLMWEV